MSQSQTHPNSESRELSNSNYQNIFSVALESYTKRTGNDLTSNPLLPILETCNSTDAVIALLREQIPGFDQSRSDNDSERLSNWLNPTVRVISAFSGTIGDSFGLAFPPARLIFTGIGALLSAVPAVSSHRDTLIIIFERIENVFRRMDSENYIEYPRTVGMIDAIVKVMVEVLCILAIATKEIKENRAKMYLKKLVGKTDIENALLRLENAILEETRMAATEALKGIHVLQDRIRGVEGMLEGVGDMLQDISQRGINNAENAATRTANDVDTAPVIDLATVPGADESIKMEADNDKVHGVQDTIEGVRDETKDVDNEQGIKEDLGARVIDGDEKIIRPIASDWGALSYWLSPPDPSVNLNVACDTHHKGTAVWFTESNTYRTWKEFGSVIWIYGKPGCGKSVLTSTIIQDIERISAAGSAYLAYYFFDFKDTKKQDTRGLLSSILVQLCCQSTLFCKILHELFSEHQPGSKQPSDSTLKQYLEKILKLSRKFPLYLVVDALDECPDTSGLQSSREKVLALVQELVGLNLPNFRLCITSRPEVDIRNVLEPLTTTSSRVSLHDEDGQKEDIAGYIRFMVCSDKKIMRWREEDKELVVETLSNRAHGMFRWVSCQFEALRRCLAPSVRQVLTELPVTLDETYERILQEIPRVNRVHTHRLLQCLAVAVRPLRVQELAEVLAIDFGVAKGIPKLDENMRWQDQEQAVLIACSSLIDVVDLRNSRMIQFSHYSVKEFLTSDRLAASMVEPLRDYHILLEPAHTTMAKACIGVLLHLKKPITNETMKRFPLAEYAAKHFADHAEFGSVISHITSAIDELLDADKPHFNIWMSRISSSWWGEKDSSTAKGSPLYHVADRGFHGLVQHLIMKRPQDVFARGGVYGTAVHAALNRGHLRVCQLLLPHCVGKDVRDANGQTPLHVAASNALVEATRMTIELGADINAYDNNEWTPLHQAVDTSQLLEKRKMEIVQLLLEHGADVAARNDDHVTVLHLAAKIGDLAATRLLLEHGTSIDARDKRFHTLLHSAILGGNPDVVRLLLERGADLEGKLDNHSTPLHIAAENGNVAVVELLLDHGANIQACRKDLCTPLHCASSWGGDLEVVLLLLERGADLEGKSDNHSTPLHIAVEYGEVAAVRSLLDHGANIQACRGDLWTPLHLASGCWNPDILQLLLECGAGLEAQLDDHSTPLHIAAENGDVAAVQSLLDHGANIQACRKDLWTPLHGASCGGNPDVVLLLLERGADLEAKLDDHSTPLFIAAENGRVAAVQVLLGHGSITHVRNNDGHTPLHTASSRQYLDIIELLLGDRADIDIQDNQRRTPLHLAVHEGKVEAVQLLLKRGASVSARDDNRQTPLQVAEARGNQEIMQPFSEHMRHE